MEITFQDLLISLRKNEPLHENIKISCIPYPITPCTIHTIILALRKENVRSITLLHTKENGFDPNFRLDGFFTMCYMIRSYFNRKKRRDPYTKSIYIESELELLSGVDVAVSVSSPSPTLSIIFKSLKEISNYVYLNGTFILYEYTRNN